MKKIKDIIIFILLFIITILICFIVKLETTTNIYHENTEKNDLNNNSTMKQRDYDCSFTRTYRMINKIDYPLAPEGISYVIVDDYQGYNPFIVIIPSTTNDLVPYKNYEFTYHLKGNGIVNNFKDLNSYLIPSLYSKYNGNNSSGTIYIDLNITETSKKGVEQINENICK